jgi:hypothetical protein
MTLLLSLACLENDPNLIPPLCFYLPRIFQGMCSICWSPLLSEPYLLPVAYSQSIKLNLMSKLPSPHFRNPDVFLLAFNPFTRKIDKLLTKGRTSGRKKAGQYLGHGPLLACFPSAAIGFFLRQSSPVDYQQLWFCFPVKKMAMPPRVRSSSSLGNPSSL